jgi:methionyl aminopeptidase
VRPIAYDIIASNSNGFKPANPGVRKSTNGSSSADLDRGVVEDDDEDDGDFNEEIGIDGPISNVGTCRFICDIFYPVD